MSVYIMRVCGLHVPHPKHQPPSPLFSSPAIENAAPAPTRYGPVPTRTLGTVPYLVGTVPYLEVRVPVLTRYGLPYLEVRSRTKSVRPPVPVPHQEPFLPHNDGTRTRLGTGPYLEVRYPYLLGTVPYLDLVRVPYQPYQYGRCGSRTKTVPVPRKSGTGTTLPHWSVL